MYRKKFILGSILVLVSFVLIAFGANQWLNETMLRHQIIELPCFIILGVIEARLLSDIPKIPLEWNIAALIFIVFSLIFWMLPHSIDSSVIDSLFNRVMQIHLFLCGFLWQLVFRSNYIELKVLFLGMLCAMLIAGGVVMRIFNLLLCSSFNIFQQRQTGTALLIISCLVLGYLCYLFFKKPGRSPIT